MLTPRVAEVSGERLTVSELEYIAAERKGLIQLGELEGPPCAVCQLPTTPTPEDELTGSWYCGRCDATQPLPELARNERCSCGLPDDQWPCSRCPYRPEED